MHKIGFYRLLNLLLVWLLSLHVVCFADAACTEFVEIDDDILTSQLLLIGERHGTNEIPALFEGLVCDLLRRGKNVWVGIEIPAREQQKINLYLNSPGRAEDIKNLTSGVFFWRGQDGRGTSSMLALLEKIRVLQTPTRKIPVIAIERLVNSDESIPRRRDKGMAEMVREGSVQFAQSTGVVLVGNIHAKRGRGAELSSYLSMGYFLADLNPISAIVFHEQGTAWNMVANKVGIFEMDNTIPLYIENPAQYVHKMKKFTSIKGVGANPDYDAFIITKKISAATPVIPPQE